MQNNVFLKVFLAILCAACAGLYTGSEKAILGVPFVELYSLIGQLFLNALNLVVLPLVMASVIAGTARMGADRSFSKLGGKTFSCYFGITLLAIMTGLACITGFFFLRGDLATQGETSLLAANALDAVNAVSSGDTFKKVFEIFLKIVPSNIVSAAAQGQMMGVIVFSLLFGFFIPKVDEALGSQVLNVFKGIFQIMMRITHFIMRFLPLGVFGLMAKVFATTGMESIEKVALFFAVAVASLLVYSLVVLPLLLMVVGRVNPIAHFRAIGPALFTAFVTSSSAASLPAVLECVEKRAGISKKICDFTVPLGASLSMSGSAIHQCVATLFIAQAYGMELSFANILTVLLLSFFTSFGVAGIPSASLISIVIILNAIGIPAEGVGLILVVERLLDMCRTGVNVLGNTCCAVLVARSEGEPVLLLSPERLASSSK